MLNQRTMTSESCGFWNKSRKLKTVFILLFSLNLFALICWKNRAKQLPPFQLVQSNYSMCWINRAKQLASHQLVQSNFSTDFQVVERGSAFVYSAYIDDRPARDLTSKTIGVVFRIFVYFVRTIDVQQKWRCLLWSEDKEMPVIAPISRVTDLNSMAKLRFMVAMVICSLPVNKSHLVVHAVSLVSSDSNETNLVGVVDLRQSTTSTSLLNRSTANVLLSNVSFTVCTSPMHGNYYTVSDIVNFIEVNRIFGAERFIFYFDADTDLSLRDCLESYRDRGIVEMYAFTPPVLEGLHYHGQILSITDCVYRTMYRTKYLINVDIDEVVVPVKANDWQTMIDAIHRRTGATAAEQIASYSFLNQFYPMEAPDDPMTSQSFLVKHYNIKSLLKTMKESYVFPHEQRSKIMSRPERILIWHVHLILPENLIHRSDAIYHVSIDDAVLHHYRSWPTKRDLLRDQRMLRNTSLITERVHFGMGFCSRID